MSRLVAKMGLSALAFRVSKLPDWNSEIVDKPELDNIRLYARFNEGDTWPLAYRTLYPVNAVFKENKDLYEVFHEFDFLYSASHELYFIIALFGAEFVINIVEHSLVGYENWLKENNFASFLYYDQGA